MRVGSRPQNESNVHTGISVLIGPDSSDLLALQRPRGAQALPAFTMAWASAAAPSADITLDLCRACSLELPRGHGGHWAAIHHRCVLLSGLGAAVGLCGTMIGGRALEVDCTGAGGRHAVAVAVGRGLEGGKQAESENENTNEGPRSTPPPHSKNSFLTDPLVSTHPSSHGKH